jgi:hypothetical protein
MAQLDRERRIRERAYRLWEEEGRPGGRAEAHWREAQRQIAAEEGSGWQPEAPDDAQAGSRGGAPADPLRNPELIPPALDPEYPAITGPEVVPDIPGARTSLNPSEIVGEPQPTPSTGTAGARRKGGTTVKLRKRQAGSTLEP